MRILKFRITYQHGETGRITERFIELGETFPSLGDGWAIIGKDQFIGMPDKNGTEIYEGDTVLRYGKHAFDVKWNKNFCGFSPLCEYRNNYGLPDAEESSRLSEVIGNIYETPELER